MRYARRVIVLVVATAAAARGDAPLPRYLGSDVCRGCHGPSGGAPACLLPDQPRHALGYHVLQQPDAAEIAAFSGIPEVPTASRICLGCHATGAEEGPRWWTPTFRLDAGVQCEACHGAGELHAQNPAGASLVRDRGICSRCHRPRPSHDLVQRNGARRAPADRRYQTPVDLALSPDGESLYVACNASSRVLALNAHTGAPIGFIPTGRRPEAVLVTPDGGQIVAASRLDDRVTFARTADLAIRAVHPVGHEPHGLSILSGGNLLAVLNTGDDTLTLLDVATGEEIHRLTAGCGPWAAAMLPDGAVVVTQVRPQPARFQQPHASELVVLEPDGSAVRSRIIVPDANALKGIAVVPAGPHTGTALFTLARTKNLVPATQLTQGWVMTHGLGVLRPEGALDQVLLDDAEDAFADASDVAVSPDGCFAAVTSGGTDRVAIIDVARLIATIDRHTPAERRDVLPNLLGTRAAFVVRDIATGVNPRGCGFAPDGSTLYVANALDDSISVIATTDWTVRATFSLAAPTELTELRRGERIFHSADVAFGRQFSCQSCHPDGHINGLTMDIEADGAGLKPVDNRTLRGILDTGPFKWEGTNPSLARQCGARLAVFFTRREPYTPEDLQALVRYECTIERPPNRFRSPEGLTPQQYRGKRVFERERTNAGAAIPRGQRCTACHDGPYKTSQTRSVVRTTTWFDSWANLPLASENLFDAAGYGDLGIFYFADAGVPPELLDAPHLTDIADGPPYLHSGAAATLEEIWTRYNYVGGHGATNDLTRRQYNDLIAYLRTL